MRITEMSALIPITLVGDNLGKRHRDFNSLVSEALKLGEPIEDVLDLPEKSAIDRLFKIDLASEQKNVQYILKNMKESDMLYVSRALKAKWLLEEQYKEIINPVKLESDVYPEMTLPAANKMKHWIHLNLRDEIRCQEFYHYYRDSDRKLAMKYLLKCSADLIVKEIPIFFKDDHTFFYNNSSKYYITPHYFKMFCERTPLIAKLVYDLIDKDKSFRLSYMDQQYEYFDSLKCILKSDPDTFLDIAEKHFNVNQFRKFGSTATKFIMSHKKDRFIQKPELYAAWLLDMNELARCLSTKECEELVIQLARSKFLGSWFDYKNVEPLIKRLDKNERTEFKKRVFVRKEVGEDVKNWPYPPPGPALEEEVFEHDDSDYEEYDDSDDQGFLACIGMSAKCERGPRKTHLDFLFDEYRFKSFTESLFELSKKILTESIPRNRMHMLLVLVSKSGGKETNLEALFQMLMKHRNEPPSVRAAVIRSLVRRAAVWRVSDEIWDTLLKFGEGLGLDGGTPEAECEEGLHAVVIRSLINTGGLASEIKAAFLKTFFPLIIKYTLSNTEKSKIMNILPNLLLDSVDKETNGETAADIMEHLLETLELIAQPNSYDDVMPAVKKLLERDQTAGKRILKRLFDSNIGRKDLFKENFDMIQLDHSYVNALKHDIGVLSVGKFLNTIVIENVELDRFLRKTSVYFAEDQGLASRLLIAMKKEKIHINLARPIAFLIGSNLKTYISNIDLKREACKDNKDIEKFCAEIRANAHLARPEFNLDSFTWRKAGVKLVANRLVICRSVDVDKYIDESLLWKRSARLATVLATRTDRVVEVLKTVATMRPTIAIKVALEYFRRDQSALRIWKIVKPLIMKIEPENKYFHLLQKLENFHRIPESIRPEFIQIMFPLFLKKKPENLNVQFNQKQTYNLILQQIHKLLPMMEPEFVDDLLMKFLQNEFTPGSKTKSQYIVHNKVRTYSDADMYIRILAKYLLLCTNENEQKERFARFGDLFFDIMEIYWQKSADRQKYHHYLNTFLQALKSNSAFFSNQYVTCLTVMHKIIKRMNSQLPMEQYLIVFVEVHLSMLYYLAVRQCIKTKPNIFVGEAKDQKKNKEGMMIIAHMFGKYIALEAQELILTYFDSVVEIYGKGLKYYFHRFRETRHYLSLHLVKGIIEGSKGLEGRLAVDLYNEYHQNNEDWDKIRELMTQKFHKNTMFFFYNDIIASTGTLTEW